METYETFDDAYRTSLRTLWERGAVVASVEDYKSIGSYFGKAPRATSELIGYGFQLSNPRARLLNSQRRSFNLNFAVAQFVWFLSGSDEVEPIAFYNSRGRLFSDDGRTIQGAYGKRLFNLPGGLNQVAASIERLKTDPNSRRAVALIYTPEDNDTSSRDIPCTIGVQFCVRDGMLNMITYMRSQSAAFVMPYDVFAFTMLQEVVACELGLDLGSYYHLNGSFHYYEDEEEMVEAILSENCLPSQPMRLMPPSTSLDNLRPLLAFESWMRTKALSGSLTVRESLYVAKEFEPYWTQICLILLSSQLQNNPGWRLAFHQLWPEYQALLSSE